jgi:hypothetical protein
MDIDEEENLLCLSKPCEEQGLGCSWLAEE